MESETEDYTGFAEKRVVHLPPQAAGQRLDAALAKALPDFSRSRLQHWIKTEKVFFEGRPVVSVKQKVWGGECFEIFIEPEPEVLAFTPEPIPLSILYEDEALIVLNKPAGLVVHPANGNWSGTLLNGLLFHVPALMNLPRAGIVHRLDKETSGLMVVAKTLEAQTHLVRQLQARTVSRRYWALVEGHLPEKGTIEAPIGRDPKDRLKMAVVSTGKPAITHYHTLQQWDRWTLIECKLETGRTHQIRVHLLSIGHPLVGDPVYHKRKSPLLSFSRQALHAKCLGLLHPDTGQYLEWESELAEDMACLLKKLESH